MSHMLKYSRDVLWYKAVHVSYLDSTLKHWLFLKYINVQWSGRLEIPL
jgi:hypothetical protein